MNEQEIYAMKMGILQLAAASNADSAIIIAAMADVLAVTAATLDRREGSQPLQLRLDSFCQRVEQTYKRTEGLIHEHARKKK